MLHESSRSTYQWKGNIQNQRTRTEARELINYITVVTIIATLCQALCTVPYTHHFPLSSKQLTKLDIIIHIFQMKKLRLEMLGKVPQVTDLVRAESRLESWLPSPSSSINTSRSPPPTDDACHNASVNEVTFSMPILKKFAFLSRTIIDVDSQVHRQS